jgi:2-isopropylmalate synthase
VIIGIHPHNDGGVAIANGLAAIRAGADHAQGTMNGVGERCGNMDLIPLIANLRLKYGLDCLQADTLPKLTETSRYVYEIANVNLNPGQPYVGSSAFAHKGGMHVHAVQKDASTYEHIDPESVGNSRKILVSELSGASNIAAKLGKKFGIEQDKDALRRVLARVQVLENEGFQFEAAEASFELLLRRELGHYKPSFELEHYRLVLERDGKNVESAEATVKLRIGDVVEHRVADGDGPVDALNRALRRALRPHRPSVADVHLIDYKVRVINSGDESASKVRVVATFRRPGNDYFGTIGVSSNVVDASWQAIVDAYDYHLNHEA